MGRVQFPAVAHFRCEPHLKLAIAQHGGGAMVRRVVKEHLTLTDPKWQSRQAECVDGGAVSLSIDSDTSPDPVKKSHKVSRKVKKAKRLPRREIQSKLKLRSSRGRQ